MSTITTAKPPKNKSLADRFWSKVDCRGPDECWPWTAKAKHPFGYGRLTAGRGINLKSHRTAYELSCGPIPEGQNVLHKCDNPPCCNPNHLFLGTKKENTQDMIVKGRWSRPPVKLGEGHHSTKFSKEQAIEIIRSPKPINLLAGEYGVTEMTIYRLKKRQTWKELDDVLNNQR